MIRTPEHIRINDNDLHILVVNENVTSVIALDRWKGKVTLPAPRALDAKENKE